MEQENKKFYLQFDCDCGNTGFVEYLGDKEQNGGYNTICPSCSKKVLFLFCKDCESGFGLPQSEVGQSEWKCPNCGAQHMLGGNAWIDTVPNHESDPSSN